MKRKLQGYTAKANQKTTYFLFIIFRVILKYINTENATQCVCKSVLPFVDLVRHWYEKISLKQSHHHCLSLRWSLISVLQYLKIIKRKEECLKENLTFQL